MKKKIGIWGFGVVGKSALLFLSNNKSINSSKKIEIFDHRQLSPQEIDLIHSNNGDYFKGTLEEFLQNNDQIIVSPGIDVLPYAKYAHKWISELDLFSLHWHKPVIAVTGTVGKTSIVHIFSKILTSIGYQVATGGNIGNGVLDLLFEQQKKDLAVLEVSSFQLELSKNFKSDISLWTNLFPNHLDRHKTMETYFDAKYKIINNSRKQKIIAHLNLQEPLIKKNPDKSYLFFTDNLDINMLKNLRNCDAIYTLESSNPPQSDISTVLKEICLVKYTKSQKSIIYKGNIPTVSYETNWIPLMVLCDINNIDISKINKINLDLPSHRLDHIATVLGVSFYNDSKSTIAQSTLQAIKQYASKPIYLFLGGISKGVDRKDLINDLKQYSIEAIFCFGAEAESLYNMCQAADIVAYKHNNLDASFETATSVIKENSVVIFSPSGASYDLYKNYNERGEHFVSLVKKYATRSNI